MASVKNGKKRICSAGVVNISAGFNNTIVSVSDENGNVLAWSSSGKMKFKGAQKSTPYAAQVVVEDVSKNVIENYGMKSVSVVLTGVGAGRESAVRALQTSGLIVSAIMDITPIVHNGCRSPKRRRV
jgi:small subunit ribosomal protein S11